MGALCRRPSIRKKPRTGSLSSVPLAPCPRRPHRQAVRGRLTRRAPACWSMRASFLPYGKAATPITLSRTRWRRWASRHGGRIWWACPSPPIPRSSRTAPCGISALSVAQGVLVLYHIAPDGTLVKAGTVKVDHAGMLHDFAVTTRHLVFVLPPPAGLRAVAGRSRRGVS